MEVLLLFLTKQILRQHWMLSTGSQHHFLSTTSSYSQCNPCRILFGVVIYPCLVSIVYFLWTAFDTYVSDAQTGFHWMNNIQTDSNDIYMKSSDPINSSMFDPSYYDLKTPPP